MIFRNRSKAWLAILSCLAANGWSAGSVHAMADEPDTDIVTAEAFDAALAVLDGNLRDKLLNGDVPARWHAQSSTFWYPRERHGGIEYRRVNAVTGENSPAFDHALLAGAVNGLSGRQDYTELNLPVTSIADQTAMVEIDEQRQAVCDLAEYSCEILSPANSEETPSDVLVSPNGNLALFRRDDNLWLRNRSTGAESALTRDGEPYNSYGKIPDSFYGAVSRIRSGNTYPPYGAAWSPDGRFIMAQRTDERGIAEYPLLESVPQDGSHRPVLYNMRVRLPGDPPGPPQELWIFDLETGANRKVEIPEGYFLVEPAMEWRADGERFLSLAVAPDKAALFEFNARTGDIKTVLEERSEPRGGLNEIFYDPPNVRLMLETNEFIWFSKRDGWGHLYLYDADTGEEKAQITSGPWLVKDVLYVDADRRLVYFTAMGREPSQDPYYRFIYRASLDGGEITLLTPEDADHHSTQQQVGDPAISNFSPDGAYFLDTYSTVHTPPVTLLRRTTNGEIITTVEEADASAVFATGWRPPHRFSVLAADGETEIFGAAYFPDDYDDSREYPIIDAIYGGPQLFNAPQNFPNAISALNPVSRASLAKLGFVVVTIDARGTAGRSREFNDISFPDFAGPQIEDHIVGLRQLERRFPGMDLDRVGIYGHSLGGYVSARAILTQPDFFKVAVSSAGSHNFHALYAGLDWFVGAPSYGGDTLRPDDQAIPDNYGQLDNARYADNLTGHLMLVYGELDENAYPAVTKQLADALIDAGKSFELVYLPNRDHEFFRNDLYYTRRMWEYFLIHLADKSPPLHYDLNTSPIANE